MITTRERKKLRKLKMLFKGLMNRGIIAKGRFLCCKSCGEYEMQRRCDEQPDGEKPLGYCFFHDQDWDSYKEDGRLYLAYGAFGGGATDCIGTIICDGLNVFDIPYEWNGDPAQRILVRLDRMSGDAE